MEADIRAQYLAEIVRNTVTTDPLLFLFGDRGVGKTQVLQQAVQLMGGGGCLAPPAGVGGDAPFPLNDMLGALDMVNILALDEPRAYSDSGSAVEALRSAAAAKGRMLAIIGQDADELGHLNIQAEKTSIVMVNLLADEMRVSLAAEWPDSYMSIRFDGSVPRLVTKDASLAERAARIVAGDGTTLPVDSAR